ncbi:response regulator receiver modulated serine phosphatase [Rubrobacter xylanophilus DSM 9941]|uniref:Response regulator receiver modulated serine phosphatase n=1 Tax=Rubrobacter xylanophilus (strain DSM 9941 / JCM 11954 / NBRC 16129 / PRD-1) TaxID=266117 RepID=Q1ASN8_RUBXD|nr:SpoIIE family protein phosphatase [Rubrobacter xylanophilus]ABG05590.1 response regulator receiver modulated serine phosphatase [Rubrobacter xylanophilus DSM 9941]
MAEAAAERGATEAPVRRLLVVDDDPVSNRLMQRRLERLGYEVFSAADGREALESLPDLRPDVLLLDVSMPGVGGLDVLEHVRESGLDAAVIMMTAYGTEEVAVESLRRGADDYLRKPLQQAEFEAVLERTVERLRLERQNRALRRQLDEKRRQLEAELSRAARVQAELLPVGTPEVPGFELAARCIPAREIGGDFYGWMRPDPQTLALTLGDVMGKGMPAALLMATARAVLRALSRQNPPERAVNLAARALEEDLMRSGSFVTLFHAQLDIPSGSLSYVDAGHGHAFVRRAGGSVEHLLEGGVPVGTIPGHAYREGRLRLEPGDTLVAYSDGLAEARPGSLMAVGEIAGSLSGASGAREMLERLVGLAGAGESLSDDLTVLVLHRAGEG